MRSMILSATVLTLAFGAFAHAEEEAPKTAPSVVLSASDTDGVTVPEVELPPNAKIEEAPTAPVTIQDIQINVTVIPETPPETITPEVYELVLAAGVPAKAWKKVTDFYNTQQGQEFTTSGYSCKKAESPDDITPCLKKDRIAGTRTVKIVRKMYAVIIDFAKPSVEKRLFLINLKTGEVKNFLVTHGKGSGNGPVAHKFSNDDSSHQTSLGLYVAGATYIGKYGTSMRLYGLEKSNSNAFDRDVVMHPAYYANESFISTIDKKTGKPFNRIGLSWGCPALPPSVAAQLIPLLKEGALIYHDHKDLTDKALTGRPVAM